MEKPKQSHENSDYYQPYNDFTERIFNGQQEVVSFLQNSTIRIWFNDQTASFPPHWHTAVEIIMPLDNIFTVNINQNEYNLNVDDILIIPSTCLHELIAPESGCRLIYLFDFSILSKLQGFSSIAPTLMEPVLITSQNAANIHESVYNLLLEIRDEYFSTNDFRELAIYSHLLTLLMHIGRNRNDSTMNESHARTYKQHENIAILNSILDYIDNNYSERIALDMIADTAGFSKYHFNRLFKQYTGTTFYNYLCNKRIQVAMDLLAKQYYSITEIALHTGFESIATFNRTFKKFKNCTPSDYRKKYSAGISNLHYRDFP